MVEFAGWEMPVQYSGVIDEHLAVRSRAGLFDVSHMGEIEVRGPAAQAFCQRVSANDVARVEVFQAQYNLLLNERGGVVDDVIFYRLEPDRYLICVNASNREKDFSWLRAHAEEPGVEVRNVSDEYGQLALQGPLAQSILASLTAVELADLKPFHFVHGDIASMPCLVARTGYTGEDGFELYCVPGDAERLWDALLSAGVPRGLVPAGLGARDTLRLEKAYPLYGHELDDATTPFEAGLGWVVKLDKGPFIGREVLVQQKHSGVRRKLAGIEMSEAGIARAGYRLLKAGYPIGAITSGTRSPTLRKAIALGYVSAEQAEVGNSIEVEIRGRPVPAKIVPLPFYR
jgi:aminomethyltransferase